MELYSTSLRDTLMQTLRELADHTENVYLSLARQYPALLRDMERSMEQSADLIDGLNAQDNSRQNNVLANALYNSRLAIQSSMQNFDSMLGEDNNLFDAMEHGMQYIGSLENLIARIRLDSEEMVLISLNALTVALKAGTPGRAFSFITEELQRVSARTITLTEETTNNGNQVMQLFRNFRNNVSQAREKEQQLFESFQPKLEECIQKFSTGITDIHTILQGIQETSTRIKQPLMHIMEEIQQQDIIKQSIDHVMMTLQEMDTNNEHSGQDTLIDELSFLIIMPDLAKTVLKDIYQRIQHSLEVFNKETQQAHAIMLESEQHRKEQMDSLYSGRHRSLLENWNTETQHSLDTLFQQLRTTMVQKENLSHNSRDLVQSIYEIEFNFTAFQTLITRFQNIDMASRIEVSKVDVLRAMGSTIDEMSNLTNRITEDVQQALESVKDFIDTTNTAITNYRKLIDEQKSHIESLFSRIRSAFNRLNQNQIDISSRLSGFTLFTDSFQSLFETTQHDLKGLQGLLQDLDIIFATLDQVKHDAQQQRATILEQMGLEEWQIENKKITQLIDRFTIYSHKKAAGKLSGMIMQDDSAESGEVTLF